MLRRQERHNEGTLTALMSTESLVQQDGCDNHTHEGKPARAYNITQCRRHCLLAQFNHPRHLESGVTPRPYSPGCNVGTIYIPIHQVYVPQLIRTPLTC